MRRRRTWLPYPSSDPASMEYIKYDALSTMLNTAINGPFEIGEEIRSSHNASTKWAGDTWENSVNKALHGDIKSAKRLAPAVLDLATAMVTQMPRLDPVYRLDEGNWIDVARYVKGEPECWGAMVEEGTAPRKGVSLFIHLGAPSFVTAKEIDQVGIQLGGTLLGLQSLGYAVQVHIGVKYSQGVLWHAPFNSGASMLDMSMLAAILQPEFFRRIVFSLMESWSAKLRYKTHVGSGYGSPGKVTKEDLQSIGLDNAVILEVHTLVNEPEKIKALIVKSLKGDN